MKKNPITKTEEIKAYFDNKCKEYYFNCFLKIKNNPKLSDVQFHTYNGEFTLYDDRVFAVAGPGFEGVGVKRSNYPDLDEGHIVFEVMLSVIENIHFKEIINNEKK